MKKKEGHGLASPDMKSSGMKDIILFGLRETDNGYCLPVKGDGGTLI